MSSSAQGAASVGLSARGNRITAQDSEDYQVVLPQFPTGQSVLNTIFFHADMRARPYRVEDFRDTLTRLALLPDVLALGAYQMNHVWAVTFKSTDGVKKILAMNDVKVKDRRCIVINPTNQEVRLKLHWLLYNVPDDAVRAALARAYGRVGEVRRERWRVDGIQDKGSTLRSVTLKLKAGVTVDDLPHELRVAGDKALVVVAGRAPQCLRCNLKGHVRRDCKVPKCSSCRRLLHDASTCVKSYASVTGTTREDVLREHLMDEADAEETAAGVIDEAVKEPTTAGRVEVEAGQRASEKENPDQPKTPPLLSASNEDSGTRTASQGKTVASAPVVDVVDMDLSGAATKRQRESNDTGQGDELPSGDEPPTKAVTVRRPGSKPKPAFPQTERSHRLRPLSTSLEKRHRLPLPSVHRFANYCARRRTHDMRATGRSAYFEGGRLGPCLIST
ncbi:uncharacterized protein LOC144173620 [Haemaphysalis longicornis]